MLGENGKGHFLVDGRTNENEPVNFHRAYFFDYTIDSKGVFRAKVRTIHNGSKNDFTDEAFRKQLLSLEFQLKGGLRINKFRNIYVLNTPGFIVNTCAPI